MSGVAAPPQAGAEARATAGTSASPTARATAPVRVTSGCQGCGACLLTCPVHAIRPAGTGAAGSGADLLTVRQDLCTGCLECLEICPADAIVLTTGLPTPASPLATETHRP